MAERLDANNLVQESELSDSPTGKTPEPIVWSNLVRKGEVEDYAQKKDLRITWLAILVVGGSASTALLSIVISEFRGTQSISGDHWAIELLTLTLVSSLSFVMGSNSGSNGQ